MSSRVERTEELFLAALDLSEAERSGFLDAQCDGDTALRDEVDELLRLDETADSLSRMDHRDAPGERIGPYELREQIGEGGMGVVFRAEQREPMRRMVAVKILKPGLDSKEIVARFEAERQALVLMDHPSIAKVHDAGTTDDGRPYFAMELIEGVPITEYCDVTNLALEDRIRLLLPVCRAVQHAHVKGVIHRDLKPSNVLVAMRDGEPVPLIIDFGIAKAIASPLTDRTLYTAHHQVLGTLEYMSPEQAEMSPLRIDTRSDVYSLGVLLYELMAGVTPLDAGSLRNAALMEAQRLIREAEPPRPSTRVSTLGANATEIARKRRVDPRALSQHMRGDLDWIAMRCLEKDPQRRYQSANDLALDLERHLRDEPVAAGPPSVGYRLRKFARRHRVATAVAFAVAMSMVLALTLVLIERQNTQRALAELEGVDRAARLRDIQESVDMGRWSGARLQALEEFAPTDRGFAWQWLHARSKLPKPVLLQMPAAYAQSIEFHPDGEHVLIVAIGSTGKGVATDFFKSTGRVRLYSIRERKKQWELPRSAIDARFLDDGRRIVTGDAHTGVLRVWEPGQARPLVATPRGPAVIALTTDPAGTVAAIVSAKAGYRVRVWNWNGKTLTERRQFAFEAQRARIRSVSLASGKLAVGDATGLVRVLNAGTGEFVSSFRYGRIAEEPVRIGDAKAVSACVSAVALDPHGDRVAVTGRNDGYYGLWSASDGGVVKVLAHERTGGSPLWSTEAAFGPDGRYLAVNCSHGRTRVHSARTGELLAALPAPGLRGHMVRNAAVAIGPQARRVAHATASFRNDGSLGGGTLLISDLARLPFPVELIGHVQPVEDVLTTADGRFAFSLDEDSVRKWDLGSGCQLFAFRDGLLRPLSMALRPGRSEELAVGGLSGRGVILDAATGAVRREFELPSDIGSRKDFHGIGISGLAYTPDGAALAVGPGVRFDQVDPQAACPVILMDAERLDERRRLRGHRGSVASIVITPARLIALGWVHRQMILWDLSSPVDTALHTVAPVTGLRIVLDARGNRLFAGRSDLELSIFDPRTGNHVDSWPISGGRFVDLDFHPSLPELLVTKMAGTALWDDPPKNQLTSPLPDRPLDKRSRSRFAGETGIVTSTAHGRLTYRPVAADPDAFEARRLAWRAARVVRGRLDAGPRRDAARARQLGLSGGSDPTRLPLVSAVAASIRDDSGIAADVRSAALRLLQSTSEDPWALFRAALKWGGPGASRASLDCARPYAEAAVRHAPSGTTYECRASFLLGRICYHLKDAQAAIEALGVATKLAERRATSRPGRLPPDNFNDLGAAGFALLARVHLDLLGNRKAALEALDDAWRTGLGGKNDERNVRAAVVALGLQVDAVDRATPRSAMKAAGPPDAMRRRRSSNAWFPPRSAAATLTLDYEAAVDLAAVDVFEVGKGGRVSKIEALDANGAWHPVWPNPATKLDGGAHRYSGPTITTRTLRIVLAASGANGIDTVRLIGDRTRQWPVRARAEH